MEFSINSIKIPFENSIKMSPTQASYGKRPDYFLLNTAIFRISVFFLFYSMKFGTELKNDQCDSFN